MEREPRDQPDDAAAGTPRAEESDLGGESPCFAHLLEELDD